MKVTNEWIMIWIISAIIGFLSGIFIKDTIRGLSFVVIAISITIYMLIIRRK